MPLPKKYKEKYKVKKNSGEKAIFFLFKLVGLMVFFLGTGLGWDLYHFIP